MTYDEIAALSGMVFFGIIACVCSYSDGKIQGRLKKIVLDFKSVTDPGDFEDVCNRNKIEVKDDVLIK